MSDLAALDVRLAMLTIEIVGRPTDDRDHSQAIIMRRDLCRLCDAVVARVDRAALAALSTLWRQSSLAGDDRTAADCADELDRAIAGGAG